MNSSSAKLELEPLTENLQINKTCPACKNESGGKICKYCGEDLQPKRITLLKMLKDIPDVFFDLEHGLFYTILTFLKRPGQEIKEYFAGDRKKHYKPLKFVLFIGGFTTFIYSHFKFTDGKYQTSFEEFGTTWNSMFLLLQFPMIAFTTWLLFKSRKYTFGEHLVANAFLIGEVSLFNIALFPAYYMLDGSAAFAYAQYVYLLAIFAYYTYSFYDWFYERKGTGGLITSFAIVFGLVFVIFLITYVLQVLLFYAFTMLGWA